MLFESLNFDDSIESGVACRPLCLAIGKMRLHETAYILLFIKENRLLAYIISKFATFCLF
jgi:hypothetical protein